MPQSKGNKPPYTADELAGIISNEIDLAGDFASSFLEDNRRKAWEYYLGRRESDQDFSSTTDREGYQREGHSNAVSEDVADMVEAMMSTLMPIFGSDVPAEFEPMGPDDEENASAESDAVANVLMEGNRGWLVLAEAIKSALLLRNGIIRVDIDRQIRVERKRFKEITDEEIVQVMQSFQDTGLDVQMTSRKGAAASFKVTEVKRRPRVEAVQPAHFLIDPNHDSIFIDDVGFCAERTFPTRSDLVEAGFDRTKVNKLPALTTDTDVDSTASKIEGQSPRLEAPVADQDVIETFVVHMRIDLDGDGISELTRFVWSNKIILGQSPADFIPYATGTAWLVPFRFSGLSVYDKLRLITDIKSRTLQQYLDNLTTNNTARTAANENTVNLDDLLAGRPNAVIRNDGPPGDDLMAFPTNDTGQSSQALLQYLDTIRDQRTGAALTLQQPQEQLAKSGITIQSIDRQMAPAEQMASLVAKTIAETLIRQVFILIHSTLRTQFPEQIMINRSGQWMPTNPSEWQARNRVNVKIGLSPAERNRKAAALQTTIQQQMMMMQAGGKDVVVNLNGIHRALLDWSRSVDLDNPEKYYVDPESEESKQAVQAAQQSQQQQQQQQMQMFTAEAQASAINSERDFVIDQLKLQFDYFNAILGSETEEAKIVGAATQQLQALQLQGRAASTNGSGRTGNSGPAKT